MGHYPFTPFNGLTLFILVLTVLIAWKRFRGPIASNWPLAGYAVIVAYTIGFSGGLNPYWVAAGVACALAIRFGLYSARLRLVELIPLSYAAWRAVALILMW